MTLEPSSAHAVAVAEGARHHANSKTYSGAMLRPHVPFLSDLIREHGITSALDYGCGKGQQYRWQDPYNGYQTIEERWGFHVTKYDPCFPPFAAEPQGTFGLVICTHTISLIPLQDLDWALERLFGFSNKVVFIAEKQGERKKTEIADPAERAIGWSAQQWLDRIAPLADARPDIVTVFSSLERTDEGKITTRFRRDGGEWRGEVVGPR